MSKQIQSRALASLRAIRRQRACILIILVSHDYLVFGSETKGLPREIIEANRETAIRIPMWGAKPRSHNLSNAAAIVVYEALRQIKGF